MEYRAPPPSAMRCVPLDTFTALYHRPSGTTHLLIEPAPQILEALGKGDATRDVLLARMTIDHDLADANDEALTMRLTELVAAGLIERV